MHTAINARLPHWIDLITDKSLIVTRLEANIDRVLEQYQVRVWATQEYKPAAPSWSDSEIQTGLNRMYRLILQDERDVPPGLVDAIAALPQVERCTLGYIAETPSPGAQISVSASAFDNGRQALRLAEVHRLCQGLASVKIAVLDTGIDLSHPELEHALLPGFDFVDIIDGASQFIGDYLGMDNQPDDEVGHGTHVAGIIAARGLKLEPGVAPMCKIIPVRVLAALQQGNRKVGAGLVDNINSGIKWAVDQGASVINMSLGIKQEGGGLPHEEVVNYAKAKGVTIVAASGNDGQFAMYYPGALPHVLAVGAIDENGTLANYSTRGHHISLVAPGSNIFSTYLDGQYAFSTGTSQASPFVAGAVAILKSHALAKGKKLSDNQVKYLLKHTADRSGQRMKTTDSGYGKLNLLDALKLMEYRLNLR